MYHWTEYAQTNAQPRPLSDKKDFGICPLIPELEPREVHTLGMHHPVELSHPLQLHISTLFFKMRTKNIILFFEKTLL